MQEIIGHALEAMIGDAQGHVHTGVGAEMFAPGEGDERPEIPGGHTSAIGWFAQQFVACGRIIGGIRLEA